MKHVDDFFREKLGGLSEMPPADAWADMDKRLDSLVPHTGVRSYKWLSHVGMVSLIAVLGVSVLNRYWGSDVQNENVIESSIANNSQSVNSAKDLTDNNLESANSNSESNISAIENEGSQIEGSSKQAQTGNERAVSSSNSDNSFQSSGHIETLALAEGESYSDDADMEFVEGVTPLVRDNNSNSGTGFKEQNVNASSISGLHSAKRPDKQNYTMSEFAAKGDDGLGIGVKDNIISADNQYFSDQVDGNEQTKDIVSKIDAIIPTAAKPIKETKAVIFNTFKEKAIKLQNRWDAGIKAGYERGFSNTAATGVVLSPYVSYKLTKRFALMVQPAVKFASATVRSVGNTNSYYKVNDDAAVSEIESFTTTRVEGSTVETYYNTRFRYSQSHDSIVKSNKTGGRYMQYELPVLLKYDVSKKVSVYGGVNFVYSDLQRVTEITSTYSAIGITLDTLVSSKTRPIAPATEDIVKYDGTPITQYAGPRYPDVKESMLRIGATVGVTYHYNNRWMIDALIQQAPAPSKLKDGYNVNAPLSAPTFRLSVGYKIKK